MSCPSLLSYVSEMRGQDGPMSSRSYNSNGASAQSDHCSYSSYSYSFYDRSPQPEVADENNVEEGELVEQQRIALEARKSAVGSK